MSDPYDDERSAADVLNAAWLRGCADLLFDLERQFPAGFFGGAGLGLLAAALLDHAHCVERSSAPRGRDHLHDDVPPSESAR